MLVAIFFMEGKQRKQPTEQASQLEGKPDTLTQGWG